jgi:hypothetical protein
METAMSSYHARVSDALSSGDVAVSAKLNTVTKCGAVQIGIKRSALKFEHQDVVGIELSVSDAISLMEKLSVAINKSIPEMAEMARLDRLLRKRKRITKAEKTTCRL